MTNTERPLASETVDELLSAELDDDFDAAASSLGLTPANAQAALAATPGVDARRRALATAAAALASVPELDAETVDRLVSGATEHDRAPVDALATRRRRDQRRRALVSVSSVAAAVIVVLIGIAVVSGSNGTQSKSSSVAAPATALGAARRDVSTAPASGIAFGDVSHEPTLRSVVQDRLRAQPAALAPNPDTATATGKSESTALANQPGATPTSSTFSSVGRKAAAPTASAAALSCSAAARARFGVAATPVLSGTGRSGGQPVAVLVYKTGGHYVVYVLARSDCSLVTRLTLP